MKNQKIYLFVFACILAILFTNCTSVGDYSYESIPDNRAILDNLSIEEINLDESTDPIDLRNEILENPWINTTEKPISTFSIDADGGSYANIRKQLEWNQFPSPNIVRTEEIINFFQMDYPEPTSTNPIALNGEIANCPWNLNHQLLRIGIKGARLSREEMPPANFVFLIDVSGSMSSSDKLELLKKGFKIYTDYMRPEDLISIVTYSGEAGVLLGPTPGDQKSLIKRAIDRLGAGGSTNGEGGINAAYSLAESSFIPEGNNRIILGTDGDFNVGIYSQKALVELIEEKRKTGIFLSVLGVGTGNYRDQQMEQIANNGNGNYEYIDDLDQAKKVFVEDFGKFYSVAKDVKIQIDFDPNLVYKYRLIGYENRILNEEDFLDDAVDAGEIGADQRITALYEIETNQKLSSTDPSITIDFRYKSPTSEISKGLTHKVFNQNTPFEEATENTRFAAAAAGYGMMLRDSEYKGTLKWDDVYEWANKSRNFDPNGHRAEFLSWIHKAKELE